MSINCLYSGRAKQVLEVSFSKFLSGSRSIATPKTKLGTASHFSVVKASSEIIKLQSFYFLYSVQARISLNMATSLSATSL
jgi:hypothetical protein